MIPAIRLGRRPVGMNSTILPPINSALPGVLAKSAKVARLKIVEGVALTVRTSRFDKDSTVVILPRMVRVPQEIAIDQMAAKMDNLGKEQVLERIARPGERARLSATGNLDDS